MDTLEKIIKKLEEKPDVDAVFLTGSKGTKTDTSNNDIDLIVILNKNTQEIRSIFTWIDGVFADIYFFDLDNVKKIIDTSFLPINDGGVKHAMDEYLYAWAKKGDIKFDKSGEITKLKNIDKEVLLPEEKLFFSWNDTNYNYETNKRYYLANNSTYHEALEVRLMYSIPQILCTYMDFIGRPWRGEKDMLMYVKENDTEFYNLFIEYTKAVDLKGRFSVYEKMIKRLFVLNERYPIWNRTEIIAKYQNTQSKNSEDLIQYWNELIK